jgi:hypothetical protein
VGTFELLGRWDKAVSFEVTQQALKARMGAEHPDVGSLAGKQRAQVVPVSQVVVAHDHYVTSLVDVRPFCHFAGFALYEGVGCLETLGIQERGPVVDDVDAPPELSSRPDERDGIVTGSAYDQSQRWSKNLDENPRFASFGRELHGTRPSVGQSARRLVDGAIRQSVIAE